ncbi:hypothetical protein GGR50DRAFT_432344 [Xylaria sp. CBS 124048]|nr:hypothetical protein GGR50DRAFT_432344 [Xylaria sp. CBS 124048]
MTAAMQPRNSAPMSQLPAAQKRKRADTSNSAEPTTHKKRRCLTDSLSLSSSDDLKVMSNVDDRYEILLQSVISSSKIQQRVSAILRHLTPPAQNTDTTATKTSISVLRAKASDAGKLISIAEIAKREIENEQQATPCEAGGARRETQTGRWFQYIALGEELREMERPRDDSVIEETVIGGSDADAGDEDEFEVMKTPFERAIEGRPLVRGVPVMSLFLSRSPIEELRKRYGEQTNILIEYH